MSDYLTYYDDLLENVVSLNAYVSSIDYSLYSNYGKSALNVLLSFSGNCVDQSNVFVSLSRIADFPARYVSLDNIYGSMGHMIGQILVDGTWITVDNSAAVNINNNFIKMSEVRYLGNKDYLFTNFEINSYIWVYYSDNSIIGISDKNNLGIYGLNSLNLMESNLVYV